MALELETKGEPPEKEKYYKVLAEFGIHQKSGDRHFKNWSVIRGAEKSTVKGWCKNGFLDSKKDSESGVVLYSCPERYEDLCRRIGEYVEDNYDGIREFQSEFSYEDIERLRDYTLDLVSF